MWRAANSIQFSFAASKILVQLPIQLSKSRFRYQTLAGEFHQARLLYIDEVSLQKALLLPFECAVRPAHSSELLLKPTRLYSKYGAAVHFHFF
jgi:hypothetical protein